jgi:hypothetical protein
MMRQKGIARHSARYAPECRDEDKRAGGGSMQVEVDEIEKRQRAKLRLALGCTDSELPDRLSRIANAAYEEYLEMIQGVPLPTRAGEVRERRLLHLLRKYAADGRLLTEREIAAMFQMSEQEAARLLRDVRSHYHEELDARVTAAIREILESAAADDRTRRVTITSANLLEVLRSTVASMAPGLDQIVKVRGSAALYDIPPDTYLMLRDAFGLGSD